MNAITAISGSYDYRLVAISIALAIFASYAALDLAGRVTLARRFFGRLLGLHGGDLNTAQERELYFQTMAEAVPEILWTADPTGADDFFNRRCFDYTGMTFEQLRGAGWTVIVHPDDLGLCVGKWESARRAGMPYEVEYRLRGKDGSYRWFLCRANPIRNSGGEIVKWFGTCADIEDQKRNQQILEQQILERTVQLADTNTRLQQEILAKDSVRKE